MTKLIFWYFTLLLSGILNSGFTQSSPLANNKEKANRYIDHAITLESVNLDSALYYYTLAGALSKTSKDYQTMHRYARNHTAALNLKGDFEKSLELNLWSLSLAQEKNDSLNVAKSLVNTANVYNYQGMFSAATKYYLEAAEYFERLNQASFLNIVYQNLAVIFDVTKQYNQALNYANKSLKISEAITDTLTQSGVLINMAGTLGSLHHYDSAIALATKGLSLAAAIKDRSNIVNAYLSLGNLHYQKKDYGKSNNYFNLTLKEAKEMRHTETIASSLQGLANNYLALGHFPQADEFITEAVEISETHGFFDRLNQQYPILANIKANLGQHKEAYHYLSKHTALNDSLNNVGLKKAVNELEHKYQVANKEKEMAEKLLEIEAGKANIRKKNIWLIASAAGIVTIALLLLYGYRLYRQKQQYHEQYVKALQKEQDLAKLKAQLEGRELERNRIAADMHDDIGGSITSILFLAEGMRQPGDHPVSETKKIAETARNLMGSVNEIIWSMNSEYDTVEDLVAYVRNHMSEFLGAVDLDYTFCIPDEIPAIKISGLERRNIYLVIKELLHNIAKHANATRVEISFSFTKKLKITVHDNGKGIDLSSERRFGNGLKNMKARMGAINGTFCIRNDVGTVAELSIPLTL